MALETKLDLHPETISALRELIQVNLDSRDGFRYAAECIRDATLQSQFLRCANERQQQADELATYLDWNGEEAPHEGSFAAAVHRTWMAIRDLLSTDDVHAVLAEAEWGEDQIKQAYEETLRRTAGSAVNDILLQQYTQVKALHDRIRDLRDARKCC